MSTPEDARAQVTLLFTVERFSSLSLEEAAATWYSLVSQADGSNVTAGYDSFCITNYPNR